MLPIQRSPEQLSGLHKTNLLLVEEHSDSQTPHSWPDARTCEGKARDPTNPGPIWNEHLFQKEFFVSPF